MVIFGRKILRVGSLDTLSHVVYNKLMEAVVSPDLKTQPVEVPKTGDRFMVTDYQAGLDLASRGERGWRASYLVNPLVRPDGTDGVRTLDFTYTPESGRSDVNPLVSMSRYEIKREREWSGPGGSKSPIYPDNSMQGPRPKHPTLALERDSTLEVVDIQTDESGRRDMVFRYVGGPARLSSGGDPREQSYVPLDQIVAVNGIERDQYLREQMFIVNYEHMGSKLKKVDMQPPRRSFLRRLLSRKK